VLHGSDGNLPEGACKCMLSDLRERWSTASLPSSVFTEQNILRNLFIVQKNMEGINAISNSSRHSLPMSGRNLLVYRCSSPQNKTKYWKPNTLKTINTRWIHFNSIFQNLFISQNEFLLISNACIFHIPQYQNLVGGIQSSSCLGNHQTYLHAAGCYDYRSDV